MLDPVLLRRYPNSERHLVGVSGGRDSVALLHLLRRAGYRDLIVCHLDHGLRGVEGADTARFVAALAERWEYRAVIAREDVGEVARRSGISVETAGRRARHALFRRVAAVEGCPRVFLAHHADDRVETFLFNLFRGAGPAGLCSPRPESHQGDLILLRPLLGAGRAEIDACVREAGLEAREDPTNTDPRFVRNRLRHEIIPRIEEVMGRRIAPGILRLISILEGEEHWAQETLRGWVAAEELVIDALRPCPDALQRRIVRRWLLDRGVPRVGFREVELVRTLLAADTACTRVNLPGNCHARRRSGRVRIETRVPQPVPRARRAKKT